MGHNGRSAIFANSEISLPKSVMAASLIAAAAGFMLFWNSHKFLSDKNLS
jgi:hypothetical protein